MTITVGPNLGVMVNGALGEQHYTQLMAFYRAMDGLVMPRSLSATTSAQPGSPSNGDVYLLPGSPTGTNWAGQGNRLARYNTVTAAWEFYVPKEGWSVYVEDTNSVWRYDGSAWKFFNGSGTTANRPVVSAAWIGAQYFDTTLGKPVWSDGTNWVDATGTTA